MAGVFLAARVAPRLLAIGVVAALAACSPIDTWRHINGVSQNDPGPDAPFGRELAAGERGPYPNLATVPPPPTREMTAVQRQRLMQNLVAERNSVAASDQRLRADYPAPPAAAADAPADAAARNPGAVPAATASPPPPSLAANMAPPQLPSPPEPETFTPPPPPPQIPAPPVAASAPPSAPTSVPAELAAAGFQPPPAVPELAPPAIPAPKGKPPKPVATPVVEPIGDIAFAAGARRFSSPQPALDRAIAAWRGEPGHIRIVGHAGRSEGAVAQLDSFRAALDRAQAVAAALEKRGIPADHIRVEAAPAADTGPGRAEILLER